MIVKEQNACMYVIATHLILEEKNGPIFSCSYPWYM